MKTVKVKKLDLIQTVQTNRASHHAAWQKAFDNYRAACIKALEDNLEAFKKGRAQRIMINEAPPEDRTKDYDRVLNMLHMSVEDIVELDDEDFAKYVQDEWQWKQHWSVSNAKYLNR